MENNIVRLPLPRRPRSIHQRRILPIHRGSRPIRIGPVVVRIQHLDLVKTHQKHAAIPAILTLADGGRGRCKLHMQLTIPKSLFRVDVSRLRHRLEIPVAHFPFRGTSVFLRPCREILPIKQDDRIRRRPPNDILRAGRSRVDNRSARAGSCHEPSTSSAVPRPLA